MPDYEPQDITADRAYFQSIGVKVDELDMITTAQTSPLLSPPQQAGVTSPKRVPAPVQSSTTTGTRCARAHISS